MNANINLKNGNENAWITAAELSDEQVKLCLDYINMNNGDNELTAKSIADNAMAADDREYIAIYANAAGGLIIG